MSQDIVSDILNQLMNAKKAGKTSLVTARFSKLLVNILDMMSQYGYIEYTIENGSLKITIKELNQCSSIKPRYSVGKKNLEKYIRRFLPARNFGFVIVSTSKGLMTHSDAKDKNLGGSLIAYFY